MTQDEYKTKAQQTYAKGYTKAQLINIIGQQSWAVDEWAKGAEQKDKTIKNLRQEIQTLKAKFDAPEVKAIRNLADTLYQILGKISYQGQPYDKVAQQGYLISIPDIVVATQIVEVQLNETYANLVLNSHSRLTFPSVPRSK